MSKLGPLLSLLSSVLIIVAFGVFLPAFSLFLPIKSINYNTLSKSRITRLDAKASSKTSSTVYVCESCGNEHIKWVGKCAACGEWNAVKEFRIPAITTKLDGLRSKDTKLQSASKILSSLLISLADVKKTPQSARIQLWSSEVNAVIGGGLVKGSVVLISGDPGVGKSTLLLQMSSSVAGVSEKSVVYISGEENPEQILGRFDRLRLASDNIFLLCDTDVDSALSTVMSLASTPALLIVDSIQMMRTVSGGNQGGAGSVTQIRDCTSLLVEYAKTSGCVVVLVGHVTKSGEVAGPRVLEHLVDTVLYMEAQSEGRSICRLLRCIKNRFGATDEVGVLQMGPLGLTDVDNPSEMFMSNSVVQDGVEGCAVAVVLEGTRPLLAEIQCLVGSVKSGPPNMAPKSSKRAADGFPSQRLLLICAVIDKHIGLSLSSRDVYVNVVGGLRVNEPAADLAVAVSIVSSYLEARLKPGVAFVGEIGLGGELRGGGLRMELRVQEALRMGFRRVIVPDGSYDGLGKMKASIVPCKTLLDALQQGIDLSGTEFKLGDRKSVRSRYTKKSYERHGPPSLYSTSLETRDETDYDLLEEVPEANSEVY